MRLLVWSVLLWLGLAQSSPGQINENPAMVEEMASQVSISGYTVIGATHDQEECLRAQIRVMQPAILPRRIVFAPHGNYLKALQMFHLQVPARYASLMFTHLPSATVFVDADRYSGEEWLGYWMAHELGHLARNSPREDDAEKAARTYRRRLKVMGLKCRGRKSR